MFDIHATTAPAFVVSVNGGEFRFVEFNAACVAASAAQVKCQIGKRLDDCFPPEFAAKLVARYSQCAETGLSVTYEAESILADGYTHWRTTLIPIRGPQAKRITTIIGVSIETTSEKIERRAKDSFHEDLDLAVGTIAGGIWTLDLETGAFETSRPLTELLAGPGHAPLAQAEYINFIYAEDLSNFPEMDRDSFADFRVMTYDGRTRWLNSRRRVIRDAAGKPTRVVALVLDVTDDKRRQRKLEDEATTDELTRLPNRRGFERIASNLLAYTFDPKNPLSMILIDLDRFKPVNDVHGHKAGDELLKDVAKRIRRTVRPKDAVARIGGDEFTIIVRANALPRVIERLEHAFSQPFVYRGQSLPLGASMGTALQTADDRTIDTLMERADKALYVMKKERQEAAAGDAQLEQDPAPPKGATCGGAAAR